MRFIFSSIFAFLFLTTYSQTKDLSAVQSKAIIKVDGVLNESIWSEAPVATDFTAFEPKENIPSTQKTEVKVVYTELGIYIGAMMYDKHPDSIFRIFSRRDEDNINADRFYVEMDTYHDKQNAFQFGVTAAGVQIDNKFNIDNFDAIWESAVQVNDSGWVAELLIPYAALRYPKNENQIWGLQFKRHIRRIRETSSWVYIPNNISNPVAYFGNLNNLHELPSPLRLFLIPYVGGTISHFPSDIEGKSNFGREFNAGLDLKYGLNESFTLDATLAPEFGQIQSDNLILNLSPFEQEFVERRPFFIEGTELFNLGRLFYARRIGGIPANYFSLNNDTSIRIVNNPSAVQLINATKITGRTPAKLGIGFINAITAETHAQYITKNDSSNAVQDVITNPMSNYNVLAINQTLKNNSYFSLMNTNVQRFGQINDANVFAGNFQWGTKNGVYALKGYGSYAHKNAFGNLQQGFRTEASLQKIKGNTQFEIGSNVIDQHYNPNDLGLLFINNIVQNYAFIKFINFKNTDWFIRRQHSINPVYTSIYNTGSFQNFSIKYNNFFLFKQFFANFNYLEIVPINAVDYYEARTPGRVFNNPAYYGGNTGISTDYRKPLAIDGSISYFRNFELLFGNGIYWDMTVTPLVRLSDKLFFKHEFKYMHDKGYGFANKLSDSLIYFGIRLVKTYSNTFSGQYVFGPNANITLRIRHYWSRVNISQFAILKPDGNLMADNTNYQGNHNRNVNFFNIDFVYTWRFAPGSDLLFVWKNNISPDDNNYGASRADLQQSYASDLLNTLQSSQLNTFTLKVLFYLDYRYFKKRNSN